MLYLGTGIVMCRRITTDTMSDSSSVHDGHGALGTGERVEVHANVSGGKKLLVELGLAHTLVGVAKGGVGCERRPRVEAAG